MALRKKEREALLHCLVPYHEGAFKEAFKVYTAAMNKAFVIYRTS